MLLRLRSQVFPAITAAEEITENDTDSEVDTKKKRYRKEKIGFRDRKVFFFHILFDNFSTTTFYFFKKNVYSIICCL